MLFTVIAEENLTLESILVTHTHHDHIERLDRIGAGVRVYAHEHARGTLKPEKTIFVDDGEVIEVGDGSINVMYTPGHLQDSICFYISLQQAFNTIPKIITGDTLFVEGCGRTNQKDVEDLYRSLERIKQLPDDTEVFAGHNYGSIPISTIAHEKQHNKYFRAPTLSDFISLRLPI